MLSSLGHRWKNAYTSAQTLAYAALCGETLTLPISYACPSPSVPAPEIERFVIDQIRAAVSDPGVNLLVRQIRYDGANGKVSITFHETGIKALINEQEKAGT